MNLALITWDDKLLECSTMKEFSYNIPLNEILVDSVEPLATWQVYSVELICVTPRIIQDKYRYNVKFWNLRRWRTCIHIYVFYDLGHAQHQVTKKERHRQTGAENGINEFFRAQSYLKAQVAAVETKSTCYTIYKQFGQCVRAIFSNTDVSLNKTNLMDGLEASDRLLHLWPLSFGRSCLLFIVIFWREIQQFNLPLQ